MENILEMSDEYFDAWFLIDNWDSALLEWASWIGGGSPWEYRYPADMAAYDELDEYEGTK